MKNNSVHLFDLFGTPVIVEPSAIITPANVFGLTLWLARDYAWPRRLWLGMCAVASYVIADITHFGGHILSAKAAKAPMDEVLIKAPMPQAVYFNNNVSPQAHRLRSVGGPIGSAVTWLVATMLRLGTHQDAPADDFFKVLAWANGLLAVGSLFPLPIIDGGVILKWTLVEQGRSEDESDSLVRRTNLGLGVLLGISGSIFTMRNKKALGFGLLFQAATAIAAGLGKLR